MQKPMRARVFLRGLSAWILPAVVLCLAAARPAAAQGAPANGDHGGIGEKYHLEFSYTWWQPGLNGNVTSDRLDVIGSKVDLTGDLALSSAQFNDLRFVLRPAKKHRFRVQYTPIRFTGSGDLTRDITFGGRVFPVSLPVSSVLEWKVLRIGYEWDFLYTPRGFVGVIVEGGLTQLNASIDSFIGGAQAEGQSPLVAFGMAGRVYPIRHLALNFEGTGLQLTNLEPDSVFKTMAFDISATYNFTNWVGVSGGWRRTDTRLKLNGDSGEVDFKGLWLGAVIRY
jgi:hypothetical protein